MADKPKFAGEDKNNSSYQGGIFYLKPKTAKAEDPYFAIKTKEGTEYVDVDTSKNVSGTLKNIEFSEYEWEKNIIKTVKFVLERETEEFGNQLYIISSSYTSTLRSILNSILGVKGPINTMSLTLYKNRQGYNGVYTLINGKKSDWKLSASELKEYIDVEHTKKFGDVTDYTRLDTFLEEQMKIHLDTILPNREENIDSILSENKPTITEKIIDERSSNEYNEDEDLFDFDK